MPNGSVANTQEVLIKFITDDTQLDATIDQLEQSGQIDQQLANSFKLTTAEINKQSAALKQVAATTPQLKKGLADVDAQTKKMTDSFVKGFEEGVIAELKKAGLTLEQFQELLKQGPAKSAPANESLKKQLRGITEELVKLELQGKDNTEQYRALEKQAGKLRDTIGDVQQRIKIAGSDTRVFDGLISAAQGVTGAFAVAQGATALFGDQNEELQKTLLKVNAAMALLQGLQQVQTVLQKESAAARLLDIVSTKGQIAAQKVYTLVVGETTGALKLFRIAMATTGIGLLVIGIIALVAALKDTDDQLEIVNKEIETQNKLVDESIKKIKELGEVEIARAEAAGASQSKLTQIKIDDLKKQVTVIEDANKKLEETRAKLEKPPEEALAFDVSALDDFNEANKKLTDEIKSNTEKIGELNHQILLDQISLGKNVTDEQKKAAEESKKAAEEAAQKLKEARAKQLQEELAAIKLKLLATAQGSVEELKLRQQLIAKQAQIDLEGEKLGANQRKLIREQSHQDQLKLEREFNEKLREESIQAQIDRNTAELEGIQDSNDQKLLLTISNIELQSQLELDAAEGNADKQKAIIAKRDAEILAVRKSFIEKQLEFDLRSLAVSNASTLRAAQRLASDEKQTIAVRISAINTITDAEIKGIDLRIEALNQEQQDKLISDQEYNIRYKELLDEKEAATENSEERITSLIKTQNEKRRQELIATTKTVLDVANQIADIFIALNKLQEEGDKQRIESERNRTEELLKAGAITEKEADRRNKRLDAEDRRLRQIQATREKQAQMFKAALQIPQAFLAGLTSGGGPVAAAIYAALATAEFALIAARPIPKFGKGKIKGQYEGFGEIGERGSELVQRDGKMFIAEKPTIVWLGKEDIVYNPQQTKDILNSPHTTPSEILNFSSTGRNGNSDYVKVAKIIAREISKMPGTNLSFDKDGFNYSIQRGLSRIDYMQRRYWSSK